jgi:hypothetical protein
MRVRTYSSLGMMFKPRLKRGYLFVQVFYDTCNSAVGIRYLAVDDASGQLDDTLFTLLDATSKRDSDDRIALDAVARGSHG